MEIGAVVVNYRPTEELTLKDQNWQPNQVSPWNLCHFQYKYT